MKKVLSLALALVMLFAVCVPAFAANPITQLTEQSGQTIVKTRTTDEGGENARRYSIDIPADTEIAWGAASTDVSYTVESHLLRNEAVQVTVAGSEGSSAGGNMKTDPANGKVFSLAYTLDGATAYKADSPVVYPAATQTLNVLVSGEAWNTAVVESYSDTLTYTAEVVPL